MIVGSGTAAQTSVLRLHVGLSLLTLFPGRVGGSETNVRGLLERYSAEDGPDRVTVLANRHVMAHYGRFARGPVRLHHVRSYRPGDGNATRFAAMQFGRLAPRLVARDVPSDFDVVHFPVTVPIPRVSAPSVVTLFDVQHHDMPQLFGRTEKRLRGWAYDDAARGARLVVTSSAFSARSIARHVGVREERIEVIPLGIDHARFGPAEDDDERVLAPLGLPPAYVVYPANLWPHKNHERLLEAFARADVDGVSLVLTGSVYAGLPSLESAAQKVGLGDRVMHLGYVEPEQMPALYRQASGMVFPSLFEGFGSPPLEAMACGCPVASSGAASLAELCAEAALIFDPADTAEISRAIERIVSDEQLRVRLREAGLARAATYTWSAAAEAHVRVYERAAGGK